MMPCVVFVHRIDVDVHFVKSLKHYFICMCAAILSSTVSCVLVIEFGHGYYMTLPIKANKQY